MGPKKIQRQSKGRHRGSHLLRRFMRIKTRNRTQKPTSRGAKRKKRKRKPTEYSEGKHAEKGKKKNGKQKENMFGPGGALTGEYTYYTAGGPPVIQGKQAFFKASEEGKRK